MPSPVRDSVLAASAGVAAAIGSAVCCAGPLIAGVIGLSGAGVAATFEPLRPYFLGASGLALGLGFVKLRREERKACEPGKACASPEARRRMRRWLWVSTGIAIPVLTFPWWSRFVLF